MKKFVEGKSFRRRRMFLKKYWDLKTGKKIVKGKRDRKLNKNLKFDEKDRKQIEDLIKIDKHVNEILKYINYSYKHLNCALAKLKFELKSLEDNRKIKHI